MKSVANIQKITKAMKMVAASKMRRAQEEVLESRGMVRPLLKLLGDQPNASGEKSVFTPITTDKGLCGGINSTVVKYTRAAIKAVGAQACAAQAPAAVGTRGLGCQAVGTRVRRRVHSQPVCSQRPPFSARGRALAGSEDSPIVVVGEKGRAQLQRDLRSNIYATVLDVGKARISYPQVRPRRHRSLHLRRRARAQMRSLRRPGWIRRARPREALARPPIGSCHPFGSRAAAVPPDIPSTHPSIPPPPHAHGRRPPLLRSC
jgi:hypothetical protein